MAINLGFMGDPLDLVIQEIEMHIEMPSLLLPALQLILVILSILLFLSILVDDQQWGLPLIPIPRNERYTFEEVLPSGGKVSRYCSSEEGRACSPVYKLLKYVIG